MGFSPRIQSLIRGEAGAVWDKRDKCWRFWTQDGPKYTREHYQKYRELMAADLNWEGIACQLDFSLAVMRINLLLSILPPKKRFRFLIQFNTFLENSRQEFCPNHFAELFQDASGVIEAHPELDRDHPMVVVRTYPARLLRFVRTNPPMPPGPPKNAEELEKFKHWFHVAEPFKFALGEYEKAVKQQRLQGVRVLPRAKKKSAS